MCCGRKGNAFKERLGNVVGVNSAGVCQLHQGPGNGLVFLELAGCGNCQFCPSVLLYAHRLPVLKALDILICLPRVKP